MNLSAKEMVVIYEDPHSVLTSLNCHSRDICSKYHNATVVSSTALVTLALTHRRPSVSGLNILLIPPHFLRPCMSSRWANLHFNGV